MEWKASSRIRMHLSFCHQRWFCHFWGQVILILRAVRAETCACNGWRSTYWLGWFKNESHAKSRQLDVSGKQVSMLCIYWHSGVSPIEILWRHHCGYFTCLYGCGSDWNISSFLLSNVQVRDIKCLSDNAMVWWSGGPKQRAISHENGLFQAVKTSSPLSYLDHRQPACPVFQDERNRL